MRKLNAFNFISLNGYYKGLNGDISWHRQGEEENDYAIEHVQYGGALLFGRITYELMADFWQTQDAMKNHPVVAEGMNSAQKIVFSRTLKTADWNKTTLIKDNILEEVRKMKAIPGKDMTILGSGSIITQFAEAGLIDEYQFMIDPVVLGEGTPVFNNMRHKLNLQLSSTRIHKSGVIIACYEPEK